MPTLQTIELFPLDSVLYPGGLLELRVFEPRYLDLIQRCSKSGEPFGVVALTAGAEVRQRDDAGGFVPEAFQAVGTLAHLERCERPQPGLLKIRCRGGQRFTLASQQQLPHGLWVGQGTTLDDDQQVAVPEDLVRVSRQLQILLSRFEQAVSSDDLPLQPPYHWNDCGWVANRWCELLPLTQADKQGLMALDNPLLRLELVADQLDRLGQRIS